jgi:RNA polymerase subunit RPABC4/transcription elongation factor Spt4
MPGFVGSMRQKADQAALEADKLIRVRREQAAIDQLRRDVSTQMDALGLAALAAYRAGEIAHPRLVGVCQQIDALNEQIGQREARIEQIRAERLGTPPTAGQLACPNCKQPVAATATFCPSCGAKIPKAPPAEVACSFCGSPVPAAAQFCPNCGQRKAAEPKTIRCANCGVELPAIAVFCPECGAQVKAAAPAFAPPPAPAPALTADVEAPPAADVTPLAPAPFISAPLRPDTPTPPLGVPIVPRAVAPVPEPVELAPELAVPVPEPAESAPEPVAPAPEPVESAPEPSAAVQAAAPELPETAPEALTKRCPSCQAELPLEAIFCPDCGARQPAA